MKIAFFTDAYYPRINGVAVSVHSYAMSLAEMGHSVCIVCCNYDDSVEPKSKSKNHYDFEFQKQHPDFVVIKTTSGLVGADVNSMSTDCMINLHTYFDTPYCLIIQDDGFPIRDNLGDFLGRWDYIGAPSVRDSFRQHIADLLLRDCLNGGFSLRSRRYCLAVARNWRMWGQRYAKFRGFGPEEDFLYSCVIRLNPWMRLRYRLPGAKTARRFAYFDLLGGFDARELQEVPFGIHGQSTIWQFRHKMRELGYDLDSPFAAFL